MLFIKPRIYDLFSVENSVEKCVKLFEGNFFVEKYVENVKKALIINQKRGFLCIQKQKRYL